MKKSLKISLLFFLVLAGLVWAIGQARAFHLGGRVSYNGVSMSGDYGPFGDAIQMTVSTNNAYTAYYWAKSFYTHVDDNVSWAGWSYGSGTGRSVSATYGSLSPGNHQAGGDAVFYYWSGAQGRYVYWTTLKTGPHSFDVQAPFDYSISAGDVSVTKGSSVDNTITVTKSAGTAESVSLSASDLPTGITAAFSPTACTPSNTCTSTLTLTADQTATAGTYTIQVSGSPSSGTTSFTLTVANAPVPTLSVDLNVSIPPPAGTNVVASADVGGTATGPINYNFWWNCNSTATTVGGVNTGAGAGCAALATPANGACASNSYGYKCNSVTTDPQTATHTYAAGTYTSKVIVERGAATPAEARSGITIVPPAFDYSLSAGDVSVTQGSSVTNTITVTKTAGTAESVTFSKSGLPANTTASFSSASCIPGDPDDAAITTCTSVLTINAGVSPPPTAGTYTITVTGSTSDGSPSNKTDTFVLTVANAPVPTANLKATSGVNGVPAPSDGPISVAYNNPAYLSWTSTNATSCAITPNIANTSVSGSGVTTGNLTANTTYSITCTGAGGTSPADTVVVNVAAPAFDYSLPPNLDNKTVTKGSSVTNTITVTKTAGTAEAVTLSAALPLPTGVTASFSPSNNCTPSATSPYTCTLTLTLTATADQTTIAGTYQIGVLGSPLDKQTGFFLTVNESGLSASCSANKTQATKGESVTWTATASGGTGTYAYTWGGSSPLSGRTGATPSVTYDSAGNKTGSVTVTSGGQTRTVDCTNSVDVYIPALKISPSSVGDDGMFKVDETKQLRVDYYPYGLANADVKQDVTTSVDSTWSSTSATIVSVNNADRKGLITGISVGTNKKINVLYVDSYGNSVLTSTAGGTNTSVTVSAADPISVNIKTHPNSPGAILVNQNITLKASGGVGGYKWSGGGTPPGDQSGLNSEFTTKYSTSGSKIITVTSGAQTKDLTLTVYQPTLTIDSFSADPSSGKTPLNVSLVITTDSNIEGTSNYSLWWNCNSSAITVGGVNTGAGVGCGALPSPTPGQCVYNDTGAKCDGLTGLQIGLNHAYNISRDYTTKVIVERGDASPKERRVSISSGKVDIKASASDGPITVDAGTSVGLSWTSENVTSCTASGTDPNWSGSKSIGPSSQNTGALFTPGTYKYTLTCVGANGLSISDYVNITVGNSLSIDSFNVNPPGKSPDGSASDLSVSISSNITGVTNNYTFYCNRPGPDSDTAVEGFGYDHKNNGVSAMTYQADDVCNYNYFAPGTYTAKVIVERGGSAKAAHSDIVIPADPISVFIKIHPNSPSSILTNQDVTFGATGGIGGYKWSGGGTPPRDQSGLHSEFTTQYSTPGFDKEISVVSGEQTGTYTFTVALPRLTIDLFKATPAGGKPPLDVSLAANVDSNIMNGTYNYTFWWNCASDSTDVSAVRGVCGDPNDSAIGAKFDGVLEKNKSVSHTYSTYGNHAAKVIVERGDLAKTTQTSITIPPNVAPTVSPLAPTAPANYCASPLGWVLRWNFADAGGDSQYSYRVVVSDAVTGVVSDSGEVISSSNSYAIPLGVLSFNKTYNWAVRVWESDPERLSAVEIGPSFTTMAHAAPALQFTLSPARPSRDEQVTLTDTTVVSGGATKTAWNWDFTGVDGVTLLSATNGSQVVAKFSTSGSKNVKLRVTDSDGFNCQKGANDDANDSLPNITIGRSIPLFREVLPR